MNGGTEENIFSRRRRQRGYSEGILLRATCGFLKAPHLKDEFPQTNSNESDQTTSCTGHQTTKDRFQIIKHVNYATTTQKHKC